MRIKKMGIISFLIMFVLLASFAPYAYTIIHGETTIPQVQRYIGSIPWEKGGISLLLLCFCSFILFNYKFFPLDGRRIRLFGRKYTIVFNRHGFSSRISLRRICDE